MLKGYLASEMVFQGQKLFTFAVHFSFFFRNLTPENSFAPASYGSLNIFRVLSHNVCIIYLYFTHLLYCIIRKPFCRGAERNTSASFNTARRDAKQLL